MAAPKEKSTVVTGLVLDFETGGRKCQDCAVTQISVHAIRLDNFEVIGKFNKYIYPYQYQDISSKPKLKRPKSKYDIEEDAQQTKYEDEALEHSHITMDMLYNYGENLKSVSLEFIEFCKSCTFNVKQNCKPIIIGQNILFDLGFLQQMLVYSGLWKEFTKIVRGSTDFWGNFQPSYIDTITLAQLAMSHEPGVTSWALGNLCEILGIDLNDAHNADADVTATFEVLKVLTSRMRNEADGGSSTFVETKKEKTRDHFKI